MTSTTSTTSINSTIQAALDSAGYSSYARYAEPVVIALQNREMEIADKLVDYAVDAGAEPEEIRTYLRDVGMTVRSTAYPSGGGSAEQDQDQLGQIRDMLRTLTDQVNSMATFARANGYRG